MGGGEAHLGGDDAVVAEHRPVAPHHLELLVLAQQPIDVLHALVAERAGVIEEFDQHDIAVLIARPGAAIRRFDAGPVGVDRRAELALMQHQRGFLEYLGIGEQIFADDGFDLDAARIDHTLCRSECHQARAHHYTQQACGHTSSPLRPFAEETAARLRWIAHRRFFSFWTSARDTIAMSCARIQSGVPVGMPASACSALTSASCGWPCRL